MQTSARAAVSYDVSRAQPEWTLPEETSPESVIHDSVLELLKAILRAWVARAAIDALVARNLAIRWLRERPSIGVDPDLCVIMPAPPELGELESLCLWKPGLVAPILAVEVVSNTHPRKDYEQSPDKHAAAGASELWVFDPKLAGPHTRGGPFRLQVWARDERGVLARFYAGEGPARSPRLGAWLVPTDGGERLRIADDEVGQSLWLTAEEEALARAEAAVARIAELEAELQGRGPR